jgi:hypothetical protein
MANIANGDVVFGIKELVVFVVGCNKYLGTG